MPARIASAGERIALRLAVNADLAGIGLVEAVQDRHQRRLAGAVLADDAVDRAALDGKVHVAVGVDGAEALVDGDEVRWRGHRLSRTSSLDAAEPTIRDRSDTGKSDHSRKVAGRGSRPRPG